MVMIFSTYQKRAVFSRFVFFVCILSAVFQAVQAAPFVQYPSNRVETNFNIIWKFKSGSVT